MKKVFQMFSAVLAVLLLVFSYIFSPGNFTAKADPGLRVLNWDIESRLNSDGSVDITEDITYEFSDSFNGVFREIGTNDTGGITGLQAYQISGEGSQELKLVESARNGDSGVYEIISERGSETVKIYFPSKDEVRTFRIAYRVMDVAVRYNDTGEFFYNYLGEGNETRVDKLKVSLTLPGGISDPGVRIYAHGPEGCDIRFGADSILLNAVGVEPGKLIAARVLFPPGYIAQSMNEVNKNAFDDIVEEENRYASDIIFRNNASLYGSISLALLGTALFVLSIVRFRRKKRYNPEDYYSIFPEECTPAVVKMLFSNGLTTTDILATLLDLNRKGYLTIAQTEEDFEIASAKEPDGSLLEHEKFFLSWIIDSAGDGRSVTLGAIWDQAKYNAAEFGEHFKTWSTLVKDEAAARGYLDETGKKFGVPMLAFSLIAMISGFIFTGMGSLFGLLSAAIGLALLVQSLIIINRRSDKGEIMRKRWKAFRQYIRKSDVGDHMDMYLIYSLALGVNSKTLRKYRLKISDEYASNGSYYWIYWYIILTNSEGGNPFDDSINTAFGETAVPSTGSGGAASGGGGGAGGGGTGGF